MFTFFKKYFTMTIKGVKRLSNKTIGQMIHDIRINLGETMEEFGKRFNTSKGTVNNWEKGRNLPNKANLKSIADLAGISVEELLSSQNDDLVSIYNSHSAEDYGKLFKYCRLSSNNSIQDQLEALNFPSTIKGVPNVTFSLEELQNIESGKIKASVDEIIKLHSVPNISIDLYRFMDCDITISYDFNQIYKYLTILIFDDVEKQNVEQMVNVFHQVPVIIYDVSEISNIYNFMKDANNFSNLKTLKNYYSNQIKFLSNFIRENELDSNVEMDLTINLIECRQNLKKIEAYETVYLNDQ